ncbi:MAG: type IV pilus modification PilV family protein [Candidatus Saccharicenans sp.]
MNLKDFCFVTKKINLARALRTSQKKSWSIYQNSWSGFSLLEVVIAMGIVFFLLLGTAEMLCYSFLLKQKADLHGLAADLVSKKLEQLKSLSSEDGLLSPGGHQEIIKDENSDRVFILDWEVINEVNGLKKIVLSLYPNSSKQKALLRAVFFRSERLGF